MLTLLNELWGIRLGGLSPQVEELLQHCVMGNFWGLVAVLLPLEHGSRVQPKLQHGGDERPGGFVVQCPESSKVLVDGVV